jgi:hypothetical protein
MLKIFTKAGKPGFGKRKKQAKAKNVKKKSKK